MQKRKLLLSCSSLIAASNLRTCLAFVPINIRRGTISKSNTSFARQTSSFTTTTTSTTDTFGTTVFSSSASDTSTTITTMADINESNSKARVRVVSYNILSSELADPEFFTKCKPEHLDKSNRLPKILQKLQAEIDASKEQADPTSTSKSTTTSNPLPVVFCLQEVSHEWATSLHVFFAERGYHMITGLYGAKFNGYMGIATAYPTGEFETCEIDLVRLSEKKRGGWPRKPRDPEPPAWRKYVVDPIYGPINAAYRYYRPKKRAQQDAWEYSQYRYNQFIAVKLKNRRLEEGVDATPFWLGNYHMPCAFRTPAVMNIHADLVGCRIQKLSKEKEVDGEGTRNIPFVLAGDFNILPESPHYSLLRTGALDKKDVTYPDEKHSMNWMPQFKGMRSAYAEMNGEEPEFTNNAHNGAMNAESFIGTLDYIFLSDEWKVKGVEETPKKEGLKGVYPDEEEPSDHVLIAASLDI